MIFGFSDLQLSKIYISKLQISKRKVRYVIGREKELSVLNESPNPPAMLGRIE